MFLDFLNQLKTKVNNFLDDESKLVVFIKLFLVIFILGKIGQFVFFDRLITNIDLILILLLLNVYIILKIERLFKYVQKKLSNKTPSNNATGSFNAGIKDLKETAEKQTKQPRQPRKTKEKTEENTKENTQRIKKGSKEI